MLQSSDSQRASFGQKANSSEIGYVSEKCQFSCVIPSKICLSIGKGTWISSFKASLGWMVRFLRVNYLCDKTKYFPVLLHACEWELLFWVLVRLYHEKP